MPTTSLKLPDGLKNRAAAAAKRRGISPHAFMVEAIQSAATAAELRAGFVAEAMAALKTVKKTGLGYRAADVHAYVRARAAGTSVARPKAKSWRS